MKLRVMVAAVALTAASLVTVGAGQAQAACQVTQASGFFTANWSANCLTSTTSNKNSNLTVAIQRVLKGRGYTISATDGIFGDQTATAVRRFQSDNGLVADGKVGANTWKALAKQIEWVVEDANGNWVTYKIKDRAGQPVYEAFRVWAKGANKGRWEVKEHQPGCGTGGDGFTLMNSTRDCG